VANSQNHTEPGLIAEQECCRSRTLTEMIKMPERKMQDLSLRHTRAKLKMQK